MKKRERWVPIVFYISLGLFLIGILLSFLYRRFPSFAGAVNGSVAHALRFLLGSITSIAPFSFAEMLIFSIPLLAILAVVISFFYAKNAKRRVRMLAFILSILMPLYPLYMLTLAPGYHAPTLDEQMELSADPVSVEELAKTAEIILCELEPLLDSISYAESGASVNPLSLKETGKEIVKAYDALLEDYPIAKNFSSRPKTVVLRKWMTYAELLGMYTFFTGEANVNTTYPDYNHPFTVAHEFAHQRGIARENEANFIAALVCTYAENEYVRYSGLFNLFEYVLNAYYRADREGYKEFLKTVDPRIFDEMRAYNKFLEPYRDHVLGEVSSTVNNAYLEMNGTPGVVSYGLVVDLAVAYYAR
jgi:Ca2+/Na+ antiporter